MDGACPLPYRYAIKRANVVGAMGREKEACPKYGVKIAEINAMTFYNWEGMTFAD